MIISELRGGFGNQLFEYAAGRALAIRHGTTLKLDVSHYTGQQRPPGLEQFSRQLKLDQLRIQAEVATSGEIVSIRDKYQKNVLAGAIANRLRPRWRRMCFGRFVELSPNYEPAFEQAPDNVWLSGYWQSERYFKAIEQTIRREFRFKDEQILQRAAAYVGALRGRGEAVISVHFRRGDMAYAHEALANPSLVYGPPVNADYIAHAARHFGPAAVFLVFSDSAADLDRCQLELAGRLSGEVRYCYGNSDMEDFAIMSACDHHIIANSSFSWWAAWLNPRVNKRVFAPRRWVDLSRFADFDLGSLLPSRWVAID